jgi:hypothetical protein
LKIIYSFPFQFLFQFHPLTHTLHDWILGGGLPMVYIVFLIGLKLKMRGAVGGLGLSRLQLMVGNLF